MTAFDSQYAPLSSELEPPAGPATEIPGPDSDRGALASAAPWRWTAKSSYLGAGALLLLLAFAVVPAVASEYWLSAILIPFLALSLAGLGLNVLTGYAGQLSLGSAAFMAVGAFGAYNAILRIPHLPLLAALAIGGGAAAGIGVLFGLPSLRIKGFYLVVSTLAAQFFVEWAFTKFGWFSNFNASGVISAQPLVVLGHDFSGPRGRYLLSAAVVLVLTVLVRNAV